MNTHLLMSSSRSELPNDQRRVTRRMLRERAVELAMISGHAPQDASAPEWEQAKRDLLNPCGESPITTDADEASESMFEHLNQEPAPRS